MVVGGWWRLVEGWKVVVVVDCVYFLLSWLAASGPKWQKLGRSTSAGFPIPNIPQLRGPDPIANC